MDGIDAALVDLEQEHGGLRVRVESYATAPYPREVRATINRVLDRKKSHASAEQTVRDICALNYAIGEAFAQTALAELKKSPKPADLIGSHGQTLYHLVRPDGGDGFERSTLQVGEPAVIAQRTGLTCVADFRVADVAAGGEGAPLVSYVDYLLLRSNIEPRVALNIGGIANLTVLPAGCAASEVRAFDTGPGNMVVDECVSHYTQGRQRFDKNGDIARSGKTSEALLERLLSHSYFSRPAPKTTGREEFGGAYFSEVLSLAGALACEPDDVVATVTRLTARSIAHSVPRDCARVIASGGGVHNSTLMEMIKEELASAGLASRIERSDAYGLPADAKEAAAFAILAFEALRGRPNSLPSSTGAAHPAILGKIVPGRNYARLMRLIFSSETAAGDRA